MKISMTYIFISIISVHHLCGKKYLTIKNAHLISLLYCFFLTFWLHPVYAQQRKIDSLNAVLITTKADTNRVNILYYLSDALYDKEPYKAIEYANRGLALSNKIAFKEGISICLNALGLSYHQLGKFDTSLIYFEKRLKIVSELKDRKGIATTYDNLCVIYIHYGKIDSALQFRIKANEIYADLNEKSSLANGYNWIGNIYKEKGEYAKSLEYYLKALKIFEVAKDYENIGYPTIDISSVYRYMKQNDKAKSYALDAKLEFEKVNNLNGVGVSLYRLALIFYEEKDNENTIKYLKEAIVAFEKTQNNYFLALSNLLLGTTYRSKGDIDIALTFFNKALLSSLSIADIVLISSINQNLGTVYYDKGNYLKALDYMLKSDSVFAEIKDKRSLKENSSNLIEIYCRLNKPDSVVKYLNRYQQLSDTLFSEQNSKSIAEMQTKYETEKKDEQIQLQEVRLENKNLVLRSSLAGGGLVLASLILIIILYKKKNKAYKQLVYQNLSIAGIKHQEIYNIESSEENENTDSEKINGIILDEDQKEQIIECLNKLIEEKAYTEPGLTINKLAEKCGTNRTYLSIVINEKYRQNFSSYINRLRIDKATNILGLPDNNIPLKELYQTLGFNSYSTFNEAFKKRIGVTPAYFQKTAKEAQNITL